MTVPSIDGSRISSLAYSPYTAPVSVASPWGRLPVSLSSLTRLMVAFTRLSLNSVSYVFSAVISTTASWSTSTTYPFGAFASLITYSP